MSGEPCENVKMVTVATMLVALQIAAVAATPSNVTVLGPCVAPNSPPVMVTAAPTGPADGVMLVIVGRARSANMAHAWYPGVSPAPDVNCCVYAPAVGAIW